ncbi:hypothetical protein DAKH74_046950 [Maudiozyma humilis]|uniref:Flavodoxin-like fold domain-containing protein n=1 Tax=Maudiozyma humilis TaxID=51915 RepID=A0AAV5S2L3_MAUHU|nr:hypothetical protein DAKH74_046950 [Kazachstania humilis]
MKVLIVFAHPDKRSFNYSLLQAAVKRLEENGNEVKVSDLYRMNWKPVVDEDDFLNHEKGTRLKITAASALAFKEKKLSADVLAEQEKLAWADTVIYQFPLWWMSMPAILKGWIDRVYASGYAYSVGPHDATHFGYRYGDGVMKGKKAFLITSVGSAVEHFSERGIGGPIEDVLFTLNHGMLFYPGFTVLPPIVTYRADSRRDEVYKNAEKAVLERIDNIDNVEPIHYRVQNAGDYSSIDISSTPQAESSIGSYTEEAKSSTPLSSEETVTSASSTIIGASSTVSADSSSVTGLSSTVTAEYSTTTAASSSATTWSPSFLPSWYISNSSFPSSNPFTKYGTTVPTDPESPTTSRNIDQATDTIETYNEPTVIKSTTSSTHGTITTLAGDSDKTTTATVLSTTTATLCSTCAGEGNGQRAGDRNSDNNGIDATVDVVSTATKDTGIQVTDGTTRTTTKDAEIKATDGAAGTATNNHISANGASTTNIQIYGVPTTVKQANTGGQGATTTINTGSNNNDTTSPSPYLAKASANASIATPQGSTPALYTPEDSNAAGYNRMSNILLIFALFILM